MAQVSKEARAADWTADVRFEKPGLPDIPEMMRHLANSGQGARIRGVETTVEGWIVEDGGELWLTLRGTPQRVRLRPLTHKVQWEPQPNREQPMSPGERDAYARLRKEWRLRGGYARLTGPLVPDPRIGPYTLEVRKVE